jgi:hypothetical protein
MAIPSGTHEKIHRVTTTKFLSNVIEKHSRAKSETHIFLFAEQRRSPHDNSVFQTLDDHGQISGE